MGLMAALAVGAVVVGAGLHLFEPGGLGGIGLMAAGAERDNLRLGGLGLLRVVGMVGGGAVARLAGDAAMQAGGAGRELIGVAIGADGLPGEGHGVHPVGIESAGAVVAELAEARWDDGGADDGENGDAQDKDGGRPDQVSGIIPTEAQESLPWPPSGGVVRDSRAEAGPRRQGCRTSPAGRCASRGGWQKRLDLRCDVW